MDFLTNQEPCKKPYETWSVKGSMVYTPACFCFYIANVEMLLLSNNIRDYYFVSQGKTTIAGLDDGEELLLTDVSAC